MDPSNRLAASNASHRRERRKRSAQLVAKIHGPVVTSAVEEIGRAWNWIDHNLSGCSQPARFTYVAYVHPYRSTLTLKIGDLTVTEQVGSALDGEHWKRAAWKLACQGVGHVLPNRNIPWQLLRDRGLLM
jgi:hypothetical protein